MEAFRLRTFIAGAVTALLGLLGLYFASIEAPVIWHGMLNHGLWAVAITMLIGIATAAALFFRRYRLARVLIAMETVSFLNASILNLRNHHLGASLSSDPETEELLLIPQLFAGSI